MIPFWKLKELNGEKIIESFYENELLRSMLQIGYYPQPDSHNRDKVKVALDLSNYATEKELEHATFIDTSDLAAKKNFIALKAEVDKLDINKLTNVLTVLSILKTEVRALDFGKLKNVPVFLKKSSDVVDNEVVKNTKFNTLKTKVNSLEKKIPDTTNLIYINQYNTDKQNLEKKNWNCCLKKY